MPSSKPVNKPAHTTKGDIFDDLGLSPEEAIEAKVKADLWRDLMGHIEEQQFDQNQLKTVLKIHQPDVSNLLRGKISKFSTGKLIQFAVRLNFDVHIQLSTSKNSRGGITNISAGAKARKTRNLAHV